MIFLQNLYHLVPTSHQKVSAVSEAANTLRTHTDTLSSWCGERPWKPTLSDRKDFRPCSRGGGGMDRQEIRGLQDLYRSAGVARIRRAPRCAERHLPAQSPSASLCRPWSMCLSHSRLPRCPQGGSLWWLWGWHCVQVRWAYFFHVFFSSKINRYFYDLFLQQKWNVFVSPYPKDRRLEQNLHTTNQWEKKE